MSYIGIVSLIMACAVLAKNADAEISNIIIMSCETQASLGLYDGLESGGRLVDIDIRILSCRPWKFLKVHQ